MRQALSTSAFIYVMDKELVEKAFVAPIRGQIEPIGPILDIRMDDFLVELADAVNSSPIDALECYFSPTLDRLRMTDLLLSRVRKDFWSVHGPYGRYLDVSSPELPGRVDAIAGYKEAILFAESLGAKVVVIHPGHKTMYDVPRNVRLEYAINSIKQIAEFAGERNIQAAVEPLPNDEIGSSLEEVLDIIEKVNTPNVGVNFDTNHLFPASSIPALIRKARGLITSVHISDQDDVERHWLPFTGKLDWTDVLQALTDADYTGPLVYETHIREAKNVSDVLNIITTNYIRLSSLMPESVQQYI